MKDTSSTPAESVSLNFGTITWTYTPQKPDTTKNTNATAKWNVAQGAAA